jgi:peptidyl-prolyl cis-trans isomerase A (cyclophilin A)
MGFRSFSSWSSWSRARVLHLAALTSVAACALACDRAPPEPSIGKDPPPPVVVIPSAAPQGSAAGWSTPIASGTAAFTARMMNDGGAATTADASVASGSPEGVGEIVKVGGDDPLAGKWTLADATKDLKGAGALVAKIATPRGLLTCKLLDDKAPITVANFVGLARGLRPWKDTQGRWVKKPAYDGTTFHRIIKGFMIQGGDAKGDGTGEPGYVIKDELWSGASHDRAGLLCMANRGPNTNGAQFFITDAPAAHLDRSYTIFGECSPVDTVHDIASWPVLREQAVNPPKIASIVIQRAK